MRGVTASSWVLAAVAIVGASACIGGRASPTTRHYVLTPVIGTPSIGDPGTAASFVLGVGPVQLPAYLDRPQMVVRQAAGSIEISEFDQWGESLRDGTTRVVAINLARLLPECRVVAFPWRSGEQIRYQVVLDIEQMDGSAGGSVALDVRWRVLDRSGKEVAARVSRVSQPASNGTAADAISRALAALTQDIARDLRATAMAVAVTGE